MGIELDEEFEYDNLDDLEFTRDISIRVVGVGGGGGNAVENMVKKTVDGVDFIIINTDVAALLSKDGKLMKRVQIGRKTTKGRGAGGKPPVAAQSAKENEDQIAEAIKGSAMVFVAAGMGGGTGTGAAPIVAEIAQSMGILTVGIVTKPFNFERETKMNVALQGIAELRKHVDALIIVPNQRLLSLKEKNISIKAAYAMVDDVLYKAVRGISDLVNHEGVINIDFEDVKSTLENAGDAHMAIGVGSPEEAVRQVVESPLLETSIKSAGKLLVNLKLSEDTPLDDVQRTMDLLTANGAPDVQVIHGVEYSSELKDEIEITVIATCFQDENGQPITIGDFADAESEVVSSVSSAGGTHPSLAFPASPAFDDEDDSFGELADLFANRGSR